MFKTLKEFFFGKELPVKASVPTRIVGLEVKLTKEAVDRLNKLPTTLQAPAPVAPVAKKRGRPAGVKNSKKAVKKTKK